MAGEAGPPAWYGASGQRWKNRAGRVRARRDAPRDPELLTRHEVLSNPPDVLVTNYSMLEYMLMRPLERPVFDATREWLDDESRTNVSSWSSTRRTSTAAQRVPRSGCSCAGCARGSASRRAPAGHLHERELQRPGLRASSSPRSSPARAPDEFRTVQGRTRPPTR